MQFPFTILLGLAVALSGCAYNAQVSTINTANVYSAYEEKIPGTVALIIDVDQEQLERKIRPSSYAGSAHSYPIIMATAFASSVKTVTESMFEGIVEKRTIPSIDEMTSGNLSGYIHVKMKHYEPRITMIQGFWTMTASSTVDLAFDFTIRGENNEILVSSSVSGSRTVEGDSGAFGGGGADVIARATEKALKDALERYAERVVNSNKVREAFAKVHTKGNR